MSSAYKFFTSGNSRESVLGEDVVEMKITDSYLDKIEKSTRSICRPFNIGPGTRLPAMILKTEKIELEQIDPSHSLAAKALKVTPKYESSDTSKSISIHRHHVVCSGNSMYFDPETTPVELLTVVYEIASADKENSEMQINRKCVVEILGQNYGVIRERSSAGLPYVDADVVKPDPVNKKVKKEEFEKRKKTSLSKAKQDLENLPPPLKRSKEDELAIFEKYSGDRSNNPRNIDIVTEKIEGVLTTMSRKTMPKLLLFYELMRSKIKELRELGEGEIPLPKPSYGESFRISVKHANPTKTRGGKFRSGRHRSIHNWGNACDITLPAQYQRYTPTNEKYRSNYVNLFVHCAQLAGFKRIGIGTGFIHVDTAEQGANTRPPAWWVYPKANTSPQAKRAYISKNWISDDWSQYTKSRGTPPPDLTGLDYTNFIYTKEGKTRRTIS